MSVRNIWYRRMPTSSTTAIIARSSRLVVKLAEPRLSGTNATIAAMPATITTFRAVWRRTPVGLRGGQRGELLGGQVAAAQLRRRARGGVGERPPAVAGGSRGAVA